MRRYRTSASAGLRSADMLLVNVQLDNMQCVAMHTTTGTVHTTRVIDGPWTHTGREYAREHGCQFSTAAFMGREWTRVSKMTPVFPS